MHDETKFSFIITMSQKAGPGIKTQTHKEENEEQPRFSGHFNVAIDSLLTKFIWYH